MPRSGMPVSLRLRHPARARTSDGPAASPPLTANMVDKNMMGLGDVLGPIGLTVGAEVGKKEVRHLGRSLFGRVLHEAVILWRPPPAHELALLACPQFTGLLAQKQGKEGAAQVLNRVADKAGLSLGPIGLTVGGELEVRGSQGARGPEAKGHKPARAQRRG